MPKLKLIQNGTIVSVTLNENEGQKESVEEFILKQLKQSGRQGISLGTLGNRIHNEFQDFKPRDYGYSQFKQYMMSTPECRIWKTWVSRSGHIMKNDENRRVENYGAGCMKTFVMG